MMKMTSKLANDLMDCLLALAISANGRLPNEEEFALSKQYAEETFLRLCNEWEEVMEDEWEVIPVDEDDEPIEEEEEEEFSAEDLKRALIETCMEFGAIPGFPIH